MLNSPFLGDSVEIAIWDFCEHHFAVRKRCSQFLLKPSELNAGLTCLSHPLQAARPSSHGRESRCLRECYGRAGIFKALSPHYLFLFFIRNGFAGWVALGGTLLCVTGSEALYADLGHFSKASIRVQPPS